MYKKTSYLIIGFLFITLTGFGQNQKKTMTSSKGSDTREEMVRSIRLEKDSKTEEIFIDIKEKAKRLQLMITSLIDDGNLTIELYDPSNEKQGNFNIATQLKSKKKEKVKGNITKSIFEPQKGKWRVKIIPHEVTGDIKINTAITE